MSKQRSTLSNLTTKQLRALSNWPTKLITPLLSCLCDGWCGGMREAGGITKLLITILVIIIRRPLGVCDNDKLLARLISGFGLIRVGFV